MLAKTSGRFGAYFNKAKLLVKGPGKNLYQLDDGINLWLGGDSVIDKCIIETQVWEPVTTLLVKKIIKQDDIIIDIGANIGYFTILFAKLSGNNGKVYAFEPTGHFYEMLNMNISANCFTNIECFKEGLSNKRCEIEISIDSSSATFHQPTGEVIKKTEIVQLTTLDDFVSIHNLQKIDVIKIDIDGHEPFVLEGGLKSIKKHNPLIILEISHLHYFQAGITAWDFFDKLKSWDFNIYREKDFYEIRTKTDFLINCGDFSHSVNVILSLESGLSAYNRVNF